MGIALLICVVGIPGYAGLAWKRPGWALGCMPPTAAAIVLYGATGSNDTASLTSFVSAAMIVLETVLIVRFGPTPNEYEQPWYKTATRIINTLVVYSLFLVVSVLIFRYFGPVLFVFVVTGIFHYKQLRRHSILMDVIGAVSMAIRQNLPLPMAMTLEAGHRNNKTARVMRAIVHFLTQGYPLSQALQKGYPRCPSDIASAIAAGEAVNQLPRIIESVEGDLMEKMDNSQKVRPVNPVYPAIVFVIVAVIGLGLMIFIVPTFSEVIADITDGQELLPASTRLLFNLSQVVIQKEFLILLPILVLAGTSYFVWVVFLPRRPEKPRWISRIGDMMTWHLPVICWFEKTRSTLQLLKVLRAGQAGGWPIPAVVRKALTVDMNLCMRSRVSRWLGEIERGEDISRSARSCGLGNTLAWAMDPTLQGGNVADILKMLEEVYRSQYRYRLNLLNAFLCPVSILILGTAVGFVIYSMFAATVSLITLTIQYTLP